MKPRSYSLMANPYSNRDPNRLAAKIIKTHRKDFQKAVDTIADVEWEFLKLAGAGRYHLWALTLPDPLRSLISELSGNQSEFASIPPEWLQNEDPQDVFARVRQTLDTLSVDERKAAWTLLASAQAKNVTNVHAWKPSELVGAA